MSDDAPKRGRGRPVSVHDNRTVHTYLGGFDSWEHVRACHPQIDDVMTGIAAAQTAGQDSTRPLSHQCVFSVLVSCEAIGTQATAAALWCKGYSRATIARYTLAARAASVLIGRLIGQHGWGDELISPI